MNKKKNRRDSYHIYGSNIYNESGTVNSKVTNHINTSPKERYKTDNQKFLQNEFKPSLKKLEKLILKSQNEAGKSCFEEIIQELETVSPSQVKLKAFWDYLAKLGPYMGLEVSIQQVEPVFLKGVGIIVEGNI